MSIGFDFLWHKDFKNENIEIVYLEKPHCLMKILQILFFIIMMTTFTMAVAQVEVSLTVDPNPTPKIADWVNREELAMIIVTNSNPHLEDLDYKIEARIYLDNNLIAETNTAKVLSRKLTTIPEYFLADEVVPFDALNLYGKISTTIAKTGMLPAGVFSFCVSLVDLDNNTISTPEEVCQPMFIEDYKTPELLFPPNNVEIRSTLLQGTDFGWSSITPNPPADLGVKYIVVISEVFNHQSPFQALLANTPLVEDEVKGISKMLWSADLDLPDDTTRYVWGVKAVTMNNDIYRAKNAGFSPVKTFTVIPDHPPINAGDIDEAREPALFDK
ncbi:MAG TPA: hypothetical protein VJ855_04475 [Marinilabiliaceae bacterium]|nr:hypothetical protein [Marinilabiliaceae bacterium]